MRVDIDKEDMMGVLLFPGDDDTGSPDVSWSYSGFGAFRQWLAQAEGFTLGEMYGFGGRRPWSDVSTGLAPLLDHPDDAGPDLTPTHCAAMLPRLREIGDRRYGASADPLLRRHIDAVRQLVVVLQLCVEKDVDLHFS
ncbi:hypothetical protein ACFXPQ_05210 [Streptomyces lydicus]|uniref:hypothetical protein n=1 Tax=Streptomyces lydicus TaxID=47763 RepID=UPI0036899BF9